MKKPLIIDRAKNILAAAMEPHQFSPALAADDWLVAAVSGGPDSLALLHLLVRQKLHRPDRVIAAHLNHGLRDEADADALFVSQVAGQWNIPAVTKKEDVATMAREGGLSLEEAGREARYRFLSEVAGQYGAAAVLTGHNAQDQAETVMMHLLRGSGLRGLRGMRPLSPVPGAPHLLLARPLLEVDRDDILAYCQAYDLRPIIDESNKDIRFERNWVRHELLPLIENRHPGFSNRLTQLAEVAAADVEFLTAQTEKAAGGILRHSDEQLAGYHIDEWRKLPLSLKRSTIKLVFEHLKVGSAQISFRALEDAREFGERGTIEQFIELPGNVSMHIFMEMLGFRRAGYKPPQPALPQLPDGEELDLVVPGKTELSSGWQLEASVIERPDYQSIIDNPDPWLAYLAADKLARLGVRRARPGETYCPLGMGGHRAKVQDVMVNRKMPAASRENWPVIADEEHILWLVGHQIDERIKVSPATKRVIRVRATRDKNV